ncbi:ABC transporter ATP-binding protein [Pseudonocardia sp. ICBG1034]|uniref:ABC transporter ATP-binding protein n=1 Tax=Pseudonocardia sp. ICBG1034 TaxID=2844381 RepID=UPI001CCAF254|nr:ABC transporter ATP-binding protein [Pseudonocardia sp. ICBG1034]
MTGLDQTLTTDRELEANRAKLAIRDLGKRYVTGESFGRTRTTVALEGIDLDVADGEFVTLIGPSGSGKSTLLMIIAGLVSPTAGTLKLDGRAIRGAGLDRGVVFQDFALFPWLTVADNVRFGLRKQGLSRAEATARVAELLHLVSLDGFGEHRPHQLSGGMKQRVAIARALACDPALLLMDEPFGALDAQTRGRLQHEFEQIWERTGKTVLFVTHSVREAVYLSDRVVVLSARPGRILEEVPVDLPRPRSVFAPEFARIERHLARLLVPADSDEPDAAASFTD